MNRDDPTNRDAQRQWLSALVDGESAAAELACRAWRDDPSARADWHNYHLIGELMRSDDVRCAPQRDAQFLGRLRERLIAEPVVLAPTVQRKVRRSWMAPMSVAAGFAAVAAVLVVMRVAAPDGAVQDRSAQLATSAAASAAPATVGVTGRDAHLIRSAELDRYLAAHRQYSSTSALAVPGGAVRNAAAAAPGR